MNALIAPSGAWLIVACGAAVWVCAGAAASLPWFAARLAFRGRRQNGPEDAEAARRVSRLCLACLMPLLFFCAALLLLASVLHPIAFFTAMAGMSAPAGTLPLLLLGSAALLFAHGEGDARRTARPGLARLAPAAAGVAMLLCAGIGWAVALSGLDPAGPGGDEGAPGRLLALPAFWWGMLHFSLSALSVGGAVLMALGGWAFRWESRTTLARGARLVRLGAAFSLCFFLAQAGAAGGWLLLRGAGFAREALTAGGRPLLALCALGLLCAVALVESLLRALRRRGSAPAAGAIALSLLFVLAVCAGSAGLTLTQSGFSLSGPAASPRHHQGEPP